MTESGERQAGEGLDETITAQTIVPEDALADPHAAESAHEASEQEETISEMAEPPQHRHVWERWLLVLVAAAVIALDQYSKGIVESTLDLFTYWAPFPGLEHIFRITHVSNTGVAFGLFQNGNTIFTILALVVSAAILIYNSRLEGGHRVLRLALGLQMGGALGNMIDRMRLGHVTDFMDFGPWPVWNLADLAIVSGTILLVLVMLYDERKEKAATEGALEQAEEAENPALETATTPIDESPAN